MKKSPYYSRWMIRRDMPEVVELDRLNFLDPWTESVFVDYLRQRDTIGLVVEHPDLAIVAGFMLYKLGRQSLFLQRLAVHPQFQLQGYGRALVEHLIYKLTPERRHWIVTEVDEQDLHAHLFFQAMGFLATSINRNQFTPHDGYTFEYRCDPGDRALASVLSGRCRTLDLPVESELAEA